MKSTLKALVPKRWRHSQRLLSWLPEATGRQVQAGPFRGLSYVAESRGSAYWPKLLGTYELELAESVESAIARRPDRVLVAGAAEGYYAVGFAVRLPESEVVAWKPDSRARMLLRELARRNGAEARIRVEPVCDLPTLSAALEGSNCPLVLVDIDGAEAVLLDPRVEPRLTHADLLVETHDCFVPGVADELVARFERPHEVKRIEARIRTQDMVRMPELPRPWRGALEQLLSGWRPAGNEWLWMESRRS